MFEPQYSPFIEILAEPGKPTQTAVPDFGLKPTNQAPMFLSVVPVLPPWVQPGIWDLPPVPPAPLACRIFTAWSVTPSSNALVRLTRQRAGSLTGPSRVSIFLITRGRLRK